ncbi:CsbD family protein [Alkalilimnicola sp. S0819]|uniref:CsbD family protein n=1 Tax=Alkalilimnicola sp. S0819 TaxID=2613922 RepID=UPI00126173D0|nr:CsbD family protein [Alkalilimnicola sp. S0819]KAB7628389.1 CsbD family protein [Alkalilimnicola sp. S0819]MPQ15292.1 CsbD family protein [Alkalilimnicola sp. S0819]
MNSDQLQGKWRQLKGEAIRQWGKLSSDDADVVQGDREALIGKIQERYGKSREEAEREVNDWIHRM